MTGTRPGNMTQTSNEIEQLSRDLLRLLGKLNFSDIHLLSADSYREPKTLQCEQTGMRHTPTLSASKNEVDYYFEVLPEDRLHALPDDHIESLRTFTAFFDNRNEADMVLVTRYELRNKIHAWCQRNRITARNIWVL